MDIDISQLRRNYTKDGLNRNDLREDPFAQFKFWFGQAVEAQLLEPNAMTLATATAEGHPTQRTVLLKNFDERGFVFFTNYGSKKARQIDEHPQPTRGDSAHREWSPSTSRPAPDPRPRSIRCATPPPRGRQS